MKIASFNINNIRKRLPNLLDWLAEAQPDAVCLQELKATDTQFPRSALAEAGYGAVWCGERTWNGVAILARGRDPVLTRTALPGDDADRQARYVEAAVAGVLVASVYAPNGNPRPGPKFDYKLAWMDRLNAHAESLLAEGVPVALAGDFNVVLGPDDIYPTRSYDDNALLQPEVRDRFRALLAQGWTEALRACQPEGRLFTFWDYRRQRWERDAGLRLDCILLSPGLAPRLRASGVDRAVRGRENASDHAPVWAELAG